MKLYLEVCSGGSGSFSGPIESVIAFFSYVFCDCRNVEIILVLRDRGDQPLFKINFLDFEYEVLEGKLPTPADLCRLPVIVMHEGTTCVAGICGVVRQLFKSVDPRHPLLGFKQSSLYACAEVSLLTQFCEVDAVNMVNSMYNQDGAQNGIPVDLARLEAHLKQPVRIHNIEKVRKEVFKASLRDLSHVYAEGPSMSIADVILYPCVYLVVDTFERGDLSLYTPLTLAWCDNMFSAVETKRAVMILAGNLKTSIKIVPEFCPKVADESLYRSDPQRSKKKPKTYTKQGDVDESLSIMEAVALDMVRCDPFGMDVSFDWGAVPWDAQPVGGELPEKRVVKKAQQLEGMVRAILKVACQGDRLVDFCAGSGHLGLILAHSLPRCTVILIENKEESIGRARERAKKLNLNNILFCQSNLDYFTGAFDVGVSLHACGVATDLVMETCISREASFVCCPCCYGSMAGNHLVQYPRSERIRSLPLSEQQYLVLGHAADQTHGEQHSKTPQGVVCMNAIDADRCLRAREEGYRVMLSKLFPPSCTPKNNLIVGLRTGRDVVL